MEVYSHERIRQAHPLPGSDFAVRDSDLLFEGVNLRSLAEKYGTPLFVFSEKRIVDNISALRKSFGSRVPRFRITYAIKAESNLHILRTIREQGVGAEVSSEGEIYLALMAGFNPHGMIFNGPAKSDRELSIATNLGLYSINLDSLDELERLYAICKRRGKVARISFRVRPDVNAGTKMLQTGTASSKFGIEYDNVIEAYHKAQNLNDYLEIVGIHAHIGSQNTSLSSWEELASKIAHLTSKLKGELGLSLKHIDIGGGLPVRHFTDTLNQPTPPFMKVVPSDDEIAERVINGLKEWLKETELIIEPGRRIVQTAGLLITKIVSTKVSAGQQWIYVDAGFNTLPSASMPWYYHILPVTKADKEQFVAYRVAGPLCDGKDLFHDLHGEEEGNPTLPRYRMLPRDLQVGDLLVFLDVGAYNMSIMDNFNGRLMAGGVFIDKRGKLTVIRRRQTYTDLLMYEPHQKKRALKVSVQMNVAAGE